jgi:hypothetical protein
MQNIDRQIGSEEGNLRYSILTLKQHVVKIVKHLNDRLNYKTDIIISKTL